MACPHFHAIQPRRQTDSSHTAMLPLGDAWDGLCRAVADAPWQPDESTLLTLCNMGYARGVCARFPLDDGDAGPDAARFSIVSDDGISLRLYYVLERDHHPLAHGPLEYSLAGGSLSGADSGGAACRLARNYVASYLRRKTEACGR